MLLRKATSLEEFQKENTRNPIQDGCCRPPEDCGFEFKNVMFWTVPKMGLVKKNGDCAVWNNHADMLCFDCDQCKEVFVGDLKKDAFVGDLKKDAMYFGIGLTFELVFVVIIYSIRCCVRRNNGRIYYTG
ncbi:hypothetical protein REPUB_Repub10bG0101200 [Reevesia pubescens]